MKTNVMLCWTLIGIAGCAGSPQVSSLEYGGKKACVNMADGRVYLVIVTDGKMGSFGVRAGPFMAPRFSGTLEPQAHSLPYSARGRYASIGADKYDLTQGRLLAVSFATGTPVVHQINASPKEMLKTFLENSAELKGFFPENSKGTTENVHQ